VDAETLTDRLARHPLLEGFTPDELQVVAEHGRELRVAPPDKLLRQGEPADELCLVLSGRVSVIMRGERGFDHEIAQVEAGGTIGELGLLGGGVRGATVKPLETVDCFVLEATGIQEMLDQRQVAAIKLFERLARTVAGRLTTMNERLCEMADEEQHPDGTVRLSLSDIRERLLQAGATGM
jgi:CRP-like cAMP-binding protein